MHAETVLLLALAAVAVIVAARGLAGRTGIPAAALLTVTGLVYALLPGPNLTLDPEVVLSVLIPPLLYSAALDSSLIAIRANLRTVVGLSVLLVLVTALVIGFAVSLFQSVTQIQEVTLTFVPKAIGVAVALLVAGHWMIAEAVSFTQELFGRIPALLGGG